MGRAIMLEHLVQYEPEVTYQKPKKVLSKVSAGEVLSAQVNTAQWLEEMGATPDDEVSSALATDSARKSFATLVSNNPEETQKHSLVQLKTPEAVRHLTGMLAAYDWEFIEQAKELRGYAVAQLVEETKNPKAEIRLKALALLGRVTEVGLFTDKITVQKEEMSDAEIDQRIKDKLHKFMGVVDALEVTDIAVKPRPVVTVDAEGVPSGD